MTLSSTLAYLSKLTTARNTLKSSAGSITAPTTINGHLFLVYSRLLELLGFVSSASHVLSPRGKTLFDAVQTLEKGAGSGSATDKLVERLMLASILMPSGCLSAKPFDQSYDLAVPADPSDRHILLIARVASLVDARTVKAQPWTGPVSRDLLVVSSHVRTATKTLHSVCESIVMAQMIKEPASELGSTDQAVELGVRLPFVDDVNTVMGVVTHAYLAALKENAAVTPPAAVATLQASTVGEGLADIGGEIARVMSFWSAMVSVAKSSGKIDLVQQFIAADEWLQPWKAVQ